MADKLVESVVDSALDVQSALWGPYWSDESTGIIVFIDAGTDLNFARTTDGGANWATAEVLGGAVQQLACWYDKETPGNVGTRIHMAWMDFAANTIYYQTLDVADGSLGTLRTVDGTATVGTASTLRIAITQTVSGNIIVAFSTQSEIECYKSSDNFATAGTSIADVYELGTEEDYVLLFPAATADDNDACALFWDRSADELSVKMWDDSAGTWTKTSISSSMFDDDLHVNMDGSVRHSDSHILIAAHSNQDTAGNDLMTWDLTVDSISSPTVTAKANVVTNKSASAQVAVFINQQNDDVYVAYLKGGVWEALVDVVFHISIDGMANWGSEQAYSEPTADDFRRVQAGRTVGDAGGRYQPVFFDDDQTEIFVNLTNDIEIAASVGGQTITGSGIASTETFGSATVSLAAQTITGSSIASLEAFGSATVSTTVGITAGAIASLEAFGSATLTTSISFTASGIASLEAFGAATVLFPPQTITGAGISSLEAFGAATISTTVTVTAGAIASAEAFGSAAITTGIVTLSPSGIASAETFGSAQITTTISFTASGITSLEAFGSASVAYVATPTGIASLETFGSATLTTTVSITADGIVSAETFGSATIVGGGVTLSPAAITTATYIVRLRDPRSLLLRAELKSYKALSWTRRAVDAGEFSLTVHKDEVTAAHIKHTTVVEVIRDSEFEFAGIIEARDYDAETQTWTLTGRDAKGFWLSSREVKPASGQEFDAQESVVAETAMLHYLNDHLAAPTDSDRDIHNEISAGFIVPSSGGRGNTVDINVRYKNLLTVLVDVALRGDLIHDLTLAVASGSPSYQYIIATRIDATVGNSSGITPVVFGVQGFDNVTGARYVESFLRLHNAVYVLGTGTGADRNVRTVTDATSIASDFRREGHIDAREADDDDKLDEAGTTAIAQAIVDTRTATMEPITVGPTTYRDVWDVGYDVTVKFADIDEQVNRRIEAVTVTLDNNQGETVKVTMGRRPQTLERILAEIVERANPAQVA